jgi:hypothetical protein
MILTRRPQGAAAMISVGLACLTAGIVAQRFLHPTSDLGQSLVAGLTGILFGLSIALNVGGMAATKSRPRGGN